MRVNKSGPGWRLLEPGQRIEGRWIRSRHEAEAEAADRWGFLRWVRYEDLFPDDPDPVTTGWRLYVEIPPGVEPDVLVLEESPEFQVVIHRSTRFPGRWQITSFGRDGEPWGDRQAATLQDALDDARWDAALLGPEVLEGAVPNPLRDLLRWTPSTP